MYILCIFHFFLGDLESYSYCALCLPSGRAEALLTADRYSHVKYHLELRKKKEDLERNVTQINRPGPGIRPGPGAVIRSRSNGIESGVVSEENFDEREFLEMWKECYGRTDLQKSIRQEELRAEPQQQSFKVIEL